MIEKAGLGEIGFYNTPTKVKTAKNQTNNNRAQNPFAVMEFMNFTSLRPLNLNFQTFKGKTPVKEGFNEEDFNKTVEFNYFKLPKIEFKDGTTHTAKPDRTQMESAKSLYAGNHTITVAPTGTGKTAIANYAISKNLYDNKRTFYTTPLKALSNDKYREFSALYNEKNVGLMTGDIKINPNAPIVIMTTEIYRNMALGAYASGNTSKFDDVGTVVFDEAHYLGEEERGKVWEESLMLTPKNVQILALSATIGNPDTLTNWIGKIQDTKEATLVEANSKDRHVPLIYYNYTGKETKPFAELIKGYVDMAQIKESAQKGALTMGQTRALDELYKTGHKTEESYEPTDENRLEVINELNWLSRNQKTPNFKFSKTIQEYYRLKELKAKELTQLFLDHNSRSISVSASKNTAEKPDNPVDYTALTRALRDDNKLPAIIFDFSRERCTDAVKLLSKESLNLTNEAEKEEIEKIIQSYEEKGIYLGRNFNKRALLNGVAPHHAGLLPSYKKLVEDLFKRKLVKVVVATSTLSAGINMPAKTTVITGIKKPNSHKGEEEAASKTPLTANEFHQMTGRAGRRGIDTIGNVVLYNLNQDDAETAQRLILQEADPLTSKFEPGYGFLSAYYQRFNDDKLLNYFEQNTLRVYQAGQNSDEEFETLQKEFEGYRNVLTKQGFLDKNENSFDVTPKGKMLIYANGLNELTFVNMIYNKKLEGVNPYELAYFAGLISGTGRDETEEKAQRNTEALTGICPSSENSKVAAILEEARKYDEQTLEDEVENDYISTKSSTDSFNAYAAYRWAELNSKFATNDSVENFKRLTDRGSAYSAKLTGSLEDGNIYKTLTQSIDAVKQIISICHYALENDELEQDKEYYTNLLKTAEQSLEFMTKPPLYDTISIA